MERNPLSAGKIQTADECVGGTLGGKDGQRGRWPYFDGLAGGAVGGEFEAEERVLRTVEKLGLEHTVRPEGRPKTKLPD